MSTFPLPNVRKTADAVTGWSVAKVTAPDRVQENLRPLSAIPAFPAAMMSGGRARNGGARLQPKRWLAAFSN
jgi:hypothetical protein